MARYRHKSEEDLKWNSIRRRLTRELDIQIADWREEALNNLLHGAWERYTEALKRGEEPPQIESDYKAWVEAAMREHITIEVVSGAAVE